ncbi:DUF494 domain-containing protein [Vitreoscilla massiliensis]|uniref:Protein Smg homolog n=1 Tax=Vitreoscilla massiliensis TaxID=1689272 RepID=A0ABY4E514_9NEIS|nr:DUF494 domain-containing protein [Vitreoscilla massiliensis]UOO90841.1 DUF494 domain-containing protein [Vitreoscilla massiliensis]
MFDVIAFLIENFQDWETCPKQDDLGHLLAEAGFDGEEIHDALTCLENLTSSLSMDNSVLDDCPYVRVLSQYELDILPEEVIHLLSFLQEEGGISPTQRELIIHMLTQLPDEDITVDHTKLLALMVLWLHQSELPILIGDELLVALHGNTMMQ